MDLPPPLPRDVGLTFAGGGNRALYQLGLLRHWGERLYPRIGAVAACSAGACVATIWLSGRAIQTHRFWQLRGRGIARNFEWSRLLRGQWPTPHPELYRDILLCAYAEGGFERIKAAPFPVLVLTARPPKPIPTGVSALLGMVTYAFEHAVRRSVVHPVFNRRLGFSAHVVDARACQSASQLARLVAASSSIPPFTPVGQYDGQRLLDGGLIDNAPAQTAEQVGGVRRNLVMLTQPYPDTCLGQRGSRLYVAPTQPPPIGVLDCTQPEQLEQTIALGESEAQLYERKFRRFLVH